jgi:hypothetical protein
MGSLLELMQMLGCCPRYSCRLVVPHLAAPTIRNVGSAARTSGASWGSAIAIRVMLP